MRVLIDTNVLIDYLSGREPYFRYADEIIKLCTEKQICGYMAAQFVTYPLTVYRNMKFNIIFMIFI